MEPKTKQQEQQEKQRLNACLLLHLDLERNFKLMSFRTVSVDEFVLSTKKLVDDFNELYNFKVDSDDTDKD